METSLQYCPDDFGAWQPRMREVLPAENYGVKNILRHVEDPVTVQFIPVCQNREDSWMITVPYDEQVPRRWYSCAAAGSDTARMTRGQVLSVYGDPLGVYTGHIVAIARSGKTPVVVDSTPLYPFVRAYGDRACDDFIERYHALDMGAENDSIPVMHGSPFSFRKEGAAMLHSQVSMHIDRSCATGSYLAYLIQEGRVSQIVVKETPVGACPRLPASSDGNAFLIDPRKDGDIALYNRGPEVPIHPLLDSFIDSDLPAFDTLVLKTQEAYERWKEALHRRP